MKVAAVSRGKLFISEAGSKLHPARRIEVRAWDCSTVVVGMGSVVVATDRVVAGKDLVAAATDLAAAGKDSAGDADLDLDVESRPAVVRDSCR